MVILLKTKLATRVLLDRVKEIVAPSYRPELHYMRGRGPACARRGQDRG